MPTNFPEPLPCPFCGKVNPRIFQSGGYWKIKCEGCQAALVGFILRADAILTWNRRPEPTPEKARLSLFWTPLLSLSETYGFTVAILGYSGPPLRISARVERNQDGSWVWTVNGWGGQEPNKTHALDAAENEVAKLLERPR